MIKQWKDTKEGFFTSGLLKNNLSADKLSKEEKHV